MRFNKIVQLTFKHKFLLLVLVLGLFFRIYRFSEHYIFEIDQDIYSLIVKDIVIDHHPRLIGQLTSVEGVFTGPFFYYLISPFYLLLNMDPIAAAFPTTLIGLATIISIYYVFNKFFGKDSHKIGAFLYAVSLPIVLIDRWIVPTQMVFLWTIWYLYCLLSILKGNYKTLPILAILIGFIWHINLGLAPLILLIPISIFLSKRLPSFKQIFITIALLFIILSPLLVFELKHGFIQTKSLLALRQNKQGIENLPLRLYQVIEGSSLMISGVFIEGVKVYPLILYALLVYSLIYLEKSKLLNKAQAYILTFWFLIMVISQLFSGRSISQYYFNNLLIVSLLILSLLLGQFYKKKAKLTFSLLLLFLFLNLYQLIAKPINVFSYQNKRETIEFIKNDSEIRRFPCLSISFITDRGRDVGFRYLFWLKKLPVVKTNINVPDYKIILPPDGVLRDVDMSFGKIGIRIPEKVDSIDKDYCSSLNSKLDPMWGVTY